MNIEIKALRRKDYNKAIQFAIEGMHFHWYLDNKFLLQLYGRYFWYLEINRATQILAAYAGDTLVGVLLAELYGEDKKHQIWYEKLYIKAFDFLQNIAFKGGTGIYETTLKEQLRHYKQSVQPDGEIVFLAANPEAAVRGVGSILLRRLERIAPGKTVYLYTDDACTYQFYEHRGFQRVEEDHIFLDMPKGKVPLTCLMYSKTFP